MRSGEVQVRAWAAGREACCPGASRERGDGYVLQGAGSDGEPARRRQLRHARRGVHRGSEVGGLRGAAHRRWRAKIAGCLGCNYCFSHEGACVQQDDMQQFYPDLHWADVLVYATPLYCFTYPAQLKAFQDRMFCGIAKSFNIRASAAPLPRGQGHHGGGLASRHL